MLGRYLRPHRAIWPELLLLLALAPRLYRITAQSLWLDELSTWWMVAHSGWAGLIQALWTPSSGYPLYHITLKLWMALAGDGEWSLRFVSALAGAGAVLCVAGAARALGCSPGWAFALALLAPFGLWYSQEATAYSLLSLAAAASAWLVLRALHGGRYAWPLALLALVASALVHRIAILLLAGAVLAWLVAHPPGAGPARPGYRRAWLAALGVYAVGCAALVWGIVQAIGADNPIVTVSHRRAGPLAAAGMSIWRFSLNQDPGDITPLLLAPSLALAGWGLANLARDARASLASRGLIAFMAAPTALFFCQLWWTRLYEPRYLMIVFPLWLLLLAYPTRAPAAAGPRARVYSGLAGAVLAANLLALFVPLTGLWSGNPVREEYRSAVQFIALRIHPDDAVIVQPPYLALAWYYYAPRASADPLPGPISFADFAAPPAAPLPAARSFLLIAPFHAATVDPPQPGARYGWAGSSYAARAAIDRQPCGATYFLGVDVLCQARPPGPPDAPGPQPAQLADIQFADQLLLRGFTLKPFDRVLRAGGTLPITLFWQAIQPPARDYVLALALRRAANVQPASESAGAAFGGDLPATRWPPGRLIADERTIVLQNRAREPIAPGRYQLVLTVYDPAGGPAAALGARDRGGAAQQVLLTTVDIAAP